MLQILRWAQYVFFDQLNYQIAIQGRRLHNVWQPRGSTRWRYPGPSLLPVVHRASSCSCVPAVDEAAVGIHAQHDELGVHGAAPAHAHATPSSPSSSRDCAAPDFGAHFVQHYSHCRCVYRLHRRDSLHVLLTRTAHVPC